MTGNIWALCIWTVLMGLELVVSDITRIVAFGDGLSDINNLYNRTSGLFPAAPYYQGRFSDGPIWLDFMSWSLGNSSANGVEVKSFANGASITNKTLAIPRWREETIKYPDLQDQLNAHLTDDLAVNRNGKGDTLYTVFAGMHDFMEGMDGNDYPDVVGGVSSTTAMINQLLFSGAKNVLVMNLPPMEFVPRAAYLRTVQTRRECQG
ncbi:hypothetical protein BC829DRAFT_265962 [Chytridium lagenaria]|nr:hypothetical protein BC829DRAFT_265962 [Chytridium lagenaria]